MAYQKQNTPTVLVKQSGELVSAVMPAEATTERKPHVRSAKQLAHDELLRNMSPHDKLIRVNKLRAGKGLPPVKKLAVKTTDEVLDKGAITITKAASKKATDEAKLDVMIEMAKKGGAEEAAKAKAKRDELKAKAIRVAHKNQEYIWTSLNQPSDIISTRTKRTQ